MTKQDLINKYDEIMVVANDLQKVIKKSKDKWNVVFDYELDAFTIRKNNKITYLPEHFESELPKRILKFMNILADKDAHHLNYCDIVTQINDECIGHYVKKYYIVRNYKED